MSRLTRDGTAETVSRDQILRRERGQGNTHFSCLADHEQDWQPCPVDPHSCYMSDHIATPLILLRLRCVQILTASVIIDRYDETPLDDKTPLLTRRGFQKAVTSVVAASCLTHFGLYLHVSEVLVYNIMFGNLEGAVRRGRGGKEKEWTDCLRCSEQHPGVWHSGGLEIDGVGGR